MAPYLMRDHAEIVKRIRVISLPAKDLPVKGFRFGQPPRLVRLHSASEEFFDGRRGHGCGIQAPRETRHEGENRPVDARQVEFQIGGGCRISHGRQPDFHRGRSSTYLNPGRQL
jgi:hypothetical protein